jgi:hypothetical protein
MEERSKRGGGGDIMNLPPPHCGPVEMEVVGTAAFEIRDMKRKGRASLWTMEGPLLRKKKNKLTGQQKWIFRFYFYSVYAYSPCILEHG